VRVSELDLNDQLVRGGRQRTETAALNYYYRERVRLMLSLARTNATTRNLVDVETQVAAARLQVSF
jgi:phosphate-selective porin